MARLADCLVWMRYAPHTILRYKTEKKRYAKKREMVWNSVLIFSINNFNLSFSLSARGPLSLCGVEWAIVSGASNKNKMKCPEKFIRF